MKKILIVGSGGHAQVVADILLSRSGHCEAATPIGYLDDDVHRLGNEYLGLPVLGTLAQIATIEHDAIIIAIGDNAKRKEIFDRLQTQGESFFTAIHPSAIIAKSAIVGIGTMICAGAIINPETRVGNNVIVNTAVSVDHHNHVEDHAHIAPGVHLGGAVRVGVGAFLGIGANVIPLRNIGAWSIVAAGATIVTNVEPGSTYMGVPAKRRERPSEEAPVSQEVPQTSQRPQKSSC